MMNKLMDWQDKVLNDENNIIKVLKGRRAGATTLALAACMQRDLTIYVSRNLSFLRNFSNLIKENFGSCINRITTYNNSTYMEVEFLLGFTTQIILMSKDSFLDGALLHSSSIKNIIDKPIEQVIYDELLFKNGYEITKKINHYNASVTKKVYSDDDLRVIHLMSPSSDKASWYVIPSRDRSVETRRNMKKILNEDSYREEIMAGIIDN